MSTKNGSSNFTPHHLDTIYRFLCLLERVLIKFHGFLSSATDFSDLAYALADWDPQTAVSEPYALSQLIRFHTTTTTTTLAVTLSIYFSSCPST